MKFKNKNTKLFLVLGASTLALGSIGFASWIIGVQQTSATSNLNVTVDTANLTNIKISYEMSSSNVTIKETTAQAEDALIKPSEVDATALKFSFQSITLQVGKGVQEVDRPTKIKVSLPLDLNEKNIVKNKEFNAIKVNSSSPTKYRVDETGAENNFTYLSYSKTINLDYNSTDTNYLNKTDEYFTFTITTDFTDQKFSLGTYFAIKESEPPFTNEESSVSKFYNKVYEDYAKDDFLMQQAVNIKSELDQMYKALNTENALTLKIEAFKE